MYDLWRLKNPKILIDFLKTKAYYIFVKRERN